jgi:hypothetical protein
MWNGEPNWLCGIRKDVTRLASGWHSVPGGEVEETRWKEGFRVDLGLDASDPDRAYSCKSLIILEILRRLTVGVGHQGGLINIEEIIFKAGGSDVENEREFCSQSSSCRGQCNSSNAFDKMHDENLKNECRVVAEFDYN